MEFPLGMLKGHFIRGTGNKTVIHNRNIGQRHGGRQYIVLHEAAAALTITSKDQNQFIVTCAAAWECLMCLLTPAEAQGDPWDITP
jgi:hypothetical protein